MRNPRQMPFAGRLIRGLAALVLLIALVGGIPWLLVVLAGNPLPTHVSAGTLWRTLTTPDDGTVLIGVVAVVAWIGWIVFTASVIIELIAVLSRRRIRISVPGLGGVQRLAGTLIVLVLGIAAVPHPVASATPVPPDRPTTSTSTGTRPAPEHPLRPVDTETVRGRADPTADDAAADHRDGVVHVVRAGDDLWTLAERYYGRGTDWRRIARGNPSVLTGGPDRLEPGWRLVIPEVESGMRHVRVAAGESLSSIADREYGDPSRWATIYDANRQRITDPDVVPVGLVLRLPAAPLGRSTAEMPEAGPADHRPRVGGSEQDSPTDRPDHRSDSGASADSAPQAGRSGEPAPGADVPAPASASSRPTPTGTSTGASTTGASTTGASTTGASTTGASTRTSGAGNDAPRTEDSASATDLQHRDDAVAGTLAGVASVLAAVLITGVLRRRRLQLRARPVGRRIPQPPGPAQQLETALGRRQDPVGLEHLDLALRAIGRDCRRRGDPVPTLLAARLGPEELVLQMGRAGLTAPPVGFTVADEEWRLSGEDVGYLLQDQDLGDAVQPYPTLASIGTDAEGRTVLINLEAAGALAVTGGPLARGAVTAIATELAFSPWADEVMITVVGDDGGLAAAIDRYNLTRLDDLDQLLDRWDRRSTAQRDNLAASADLAGSTALDLRVDPDRADAWVPELALIMNAPEPGQAERLQRLVTAEPRAAIAAVLIGDHAPTRWRLHIDGGTAAAATGTLSPLGWTFTPQSITEPVSDAIQDLITCTGRIDTEPAPWWAADFPPGTLGPARARADTAAIGGIGPPEPNGPSVNDRSRPDPDRHQQAAGSPGWPSDAARSRIGIDSTVALQSRENHLRILVEHPAESEEAVAVPNPYPGAPAPAPRHPTLLLLGPIQLVGAAGTPPNRATLQCIEYCTWLLEHPASTAHAMAAGLVVAEGTRRSNMSRLRTWLGSDDRGEPYLPDAYSGRILLSPLVSSDWHRLQILTATGVNRTGTEGLCRALDLVRGAPLADAAPGQWHWAEEMRTDMVSVIRDIGVELTDRALADADIDLARWAASRSLTAAPQDEFLLGARIRTEHQAGNAAEVERLSLQVAAHSRALGIDLHPATVDLLQQVLEGRLRARA